MDVLLRFRLLELAFRDMGFLFAAARDDVGEGLLETCFGFGVDGVVVFSVCVDVRESGVLCSRGARSAKENGLSPKTFLGKDGGGRIAGKPGDSAWRPLGTQLSVWPSAPQAVKSWLMALLVVEL